MGGAVAPGRDAQSGLESSHRKVEDGGGGGRQSRKWQRNRRRRRRRRKRKRKDRTHGFNDTVCCYVKRRRK